jgi:hypothetical protein
MIVCSLCFSLVVSLVKVKLADCFKPDKTTLCVLSVDPRGANGGNLVAGLRTLKAMQGAMTGVPLVSPTWITACGKSFVLPDSTMFVRTLPTKTTGADTTDFGVAAIAAAIRSSRMQAATLQYKVFNGVSVYLCGRFDKTIAQLMREAGAEVLTTSSTVVSKVRSLSVDGGPKVILLCSDKDCKIPTSVAKEIRSNKSQVRVVNVDWLFDSIACGSALAAGAYAPKVKQAKELWDFTEALIR